jgi:gamma-glutamyltranspeptidase/glutathione hydrolase
MATEPGVVSLGGGAYVAVWPADGDPVVIDGNVEMPGRGGDAARLGGGIRELGSDYGGGVTMLVGPGSVATPGIVPAFAAAAERYAALPWSRLVEPAAHAALSYPMGAAAARYLSHVADDLFAGDDEARDVVLGPGGSAPAGRRRVHERGAVEHPGSARSRGSVPLPRRRRRAGAGRGHE